MFLAPLNPFTSLMKTWIVLLLVANFLGLKFLNVCKLCCNYILKVKKTNIFVNVLENRWKIVGKLSTVLLMQNKIFIPFHSNHKRSHPNGKVAQNLLYRVTDRFQAIWPFLQIKLHWSVFFLIWRIYLIMHIKVIHWQKWGVTQPNEFWVDIHWWNNTCESVLHIIKF